MVPCDGINHNNNNNTMSTPITIKWGKQTLNLPIQQGTSGADLKQKLYTLTNVPPTRQKILCPKLWKGALKDTHVIDISPQSNAKITLIGTTDKLVEKSMDERPVFVEDLTREELWKLEQSANNEGGDNGDDPIIDIVALQKEYGMDRDDGKMEMYEYNRLTTGLPQQQINDMLLRRMEKRDEESLGESHNNNELQGELAMTMGLQLRRAYVNALAVLDDGTLVSGLDDGHVQMWRRGEMVKDARHTGGCVDEIVVLPSSSQHSGPVLATAGDGTICIWSQEYRHLATLPCFPGTTVSSMTVGRALQEDGEGSIMYLAACFRITRQTDPNQFRLLPQNQMERRRREAAEMQEQMIQRQLLDVARRVKVWVYDESQSRNGTTAFNEELIFPHAANIADRVPNVTNVACVAGKLVCSDELGLHVFDSTRDGRFQKKLGLQFQHSCDVHCIESLQDDTSMAISISRKSTEQISDTSSAVRFPIPTARGVYIVNLETATITTVLDGHRDKVTCICPLPDGSLLTAGGKFDATVQLWQSEILAEATKKQDEHDKLKIVTDSKQMKNPGYVFDLKVLSDKNGSGVFAIAAIRYNRITVLI